MKHFRTIKAHYDDGDFMITRIRATIPECVRMYLDKQENSRTCRAIEFLSSIKARVLKAKEAYAA